MYGNFDLSIILLDYPFEIPSEFPRNMSNKKIASAVSKVSKLTGAPVINNEFTLDVSAFSNMEVADITESLRYHIDLIKGEREAWLIDYDPEEKKIEVELDPDEQETEKEKTVSKKAGLIMPVGLFHQKLKDGKYAKEVTEDGAVYMTAILEYITSEVLELAGIACRDGGRRRIMPRDIQNAVQGDEELNRLLNPPSFPIDLPAKPKSDGEESDDTPAPVVAAAKKAKSKKSKGTTIYLLFDTTQFGNSSDADYELDYAFSGAFRSKEAALKSFANILIKRELEDTNESTFFDESGSLLPNIESILEDYGWKLMEETLE